MTRVEIVGTKEEDPDNRCDDSKPDAPGLPGNEALSNVEDAANPEKLAENQRHEHCQVGQEISAVHDAPAEPKGAKGNQRRSDRALASLMKPIVVIAFVFSKNTARD
jgi:hypothetical protein